MGRPAADRTKIRARMLCTAAELFMEKGYTETSMRLLAQQAGVDVNAIVRTFGCKEGILCELAAYVLEGQFDVASQMLRGTADDPTLFYATETALQLYMAESRESVRNLYLVAYSLPSTLEIIHRTVAGKLAQLFGARLPHLLPGDFYELEIATGGIMRSFMARPCDEAFPIERKVRRFLEASFRVLQVPEAHSQVAIAFVQQLGLAGRAEEAITHLIASLKASGNDYHQAFFPMTDDAEA